MLRTLGVLWRRLSGGSKDGAARPGRADVEVVRPARIVGGRPAPSRQAGAAAPVPAVVSRVEPPAQADVAPGDPFGPFAAALGVEVPRAQQPLPDDEAATDAALEALVLERFRASRPEQASFPALALEVLNLVARPDAQLSDLTRIISRDPALSAGVLSFANSPLYRGVSEVETVREAVARLGLVEVGHAAAAVAARTLFSSRLRAEQALAGARADALFRQAMTVGTAAAALALRQPGARADRVYLGGLLHDVGRTLALFALARLVLDGRAQQPPPERLERVLDHLNVTIGGEAHQAWGLPHYLGELCLRQHEEVVPAEPELVDLHLVRLTAALAALDDRLLAPRAAREIVQSAGALRLDPFAVRTVSADLRMAEGRAAALPRA